MQVSWAGASRTRHNFCRRSGGRRPLGLPHRDVQGGISDIWPEGRRDASLLLPSHPSSLPGPGPSGCRPGAGAAGSSSPGLCLTGGAGFTSSLSVGCYNHAWALYSVFSTVWPVASHSGQEGSEEATVSMTPGAQQGSEVCPGCSASTWLAG